jgi:hypothetical protein
MASDELKMRMGQKPVEKKSVTDDLLVLNSLKYSIPADLSMVDKRRMVNNYFDISEYTSSSNEMIIKLNSSTDFINAANSYLLVKVTAGNTAVENLCFPDAAGASALFSRILVESKDGSELSRIDRLNHYIRNYLPLKCPSDYLATTASAAGIVEGYQGANTTTGQPLPVAPRALGGSGLSLVNEQVYCIPLWYLSPIFSHKNKLMPPQLTSGMRIRLTLASASQCLVRQGDNAAASQPGINYTISDPRVVTDNYQLSPLVQRQIMQMAGNQGLDYVYEDCWESQQSFASTDINFEINKSVSRATGVMWFSQETADVTAGQNQFGPSVSKDIRYQMRLGDLYFPQNPIESTNANVAEFYYHTQIGVKKADVCQKQNKLNITNFAGTAGLGNNYGIHYQTLERSSALEMSGNPINNSRSLVLNIRYSDNNARTLRAYLKYVKLAKVFARNVVVKE